jgi:hypothetical protein
MTFPDALNVLRKGRKIGGEEKEAVQIVKHEIVQGSNFALTVATLAAELTDSTNPAFSYHILRSILESGSEKIEGNIALRGLFINKILSSNSVREGIIKCMVALAACTKVTGE